MSIFALTASDAQRVLRVAEGFDFADDYSRVMERGAFPMTAFRFGIPRASQLEFFGDADYTQLFAAKVAHLESLGGKCIEIDFEPFLQTARLLYEGPWVAERYSAIADFIASNPQSLHPVTKQIIDSATQRTAVEVFHAQHRLQALRRQTASIWKQIDVLVTPTAGTIYRIDEVEADPVRLNSNLGYYTNFVNLLDLAAVAVPAGFRSDGLPFGITLIAVSGSDESLLRLAARTHQLVHSSCGVKITVGDAARSMLDDVAPGFVGIAVCGAHMQGLPLNHQLTSRGGYFVRQTRSAPTYRLYALPGGPPARPGMVKSDEQGRAIELEVWALPQQQVGSFLAGIPAPLGLGKVQLADGSSITGFTCETTAVANAQDITHLGGWRAFLKS